VSEFAFLDPSAFFPLPKSFNFSEYIEIEREMWALFPETQGGRVNFCQTGLTAQIYIESRDNGELHSSETYFLMPCQDRTLRPVRMKALRRLTLEEFRMSHHTAARLAHQMGRTQRIFDRVHHQILGPELLQR
jgi:hypothetical protein